MPIAVTCTCQKSFNLKDELAGQVLTCPRCGSAVQVPAAPAVSVQADPVFDRDTFLINQRIAIDARYQITDEAGAPLVYVVRPTYLLRNLAALTAGFIAGMAWFALFGLMADSFGAGSSIGGIMVLVGGLGFFAVLFAVAIALSKKRHTTVYRDEAGRQTLLVIKQDRKFQFITWTYTITDKDDNVLGLLQKNMLYNLIRKRWYLNATDGRRIAVAKEESIILSLLRRLLGPLFGLLRTNFIILKGDGEQVIGEFNRKMTILDRYVLDLKADRTRELDRRLALALGLMLDTGERR